MPNGGGVPCCALCKWATDQSIKNDNIRCRHHKMTIRDSHFTFCSMLEHRTSNWLWMGDENLEPDVIYTWVEFTYKDRHAPGLPMYQHEYVPLALVSEYAGWTQKQDRDARHQAHEQVLDKYRPKPGDVPERPGFLSWIRDVLSRFRNGGE